MIGHERKRIDSYYCVTCACGKEFSNRKRKVAIEKYQKHLASLRGKEE